MKHFIASIIISCSVIDVLSTLRPGAEWVAQDLNVTWLDKTQTEPENIEIQAAIKDCDTQEVDKQQALSDASNQQLTPGSRIDALIKALDIN